MKKIPMKTGKFALVDDQDYEFVSGYNWYEQKCGHSKDNSYAYARVPMTGARVAMHRMILEAQKGQQIDHINGDGLDNRRANLRFATQSQNLASARNHKNKYRGVHWNKNLGKWQANIQVNKKLHYLGVFTDDKEAARAYNEAAKEHFGEFAWQNTV